jgi:hypothetical protein
VKRALKSNHRAESQGACHSANDYKIIVVHEHGPLAKLTFGDRTLKGVG